MRFLKTENHHQHIDVKSSTSHKQAFKKYNCEHYSQVTDYQKEEILISGNQQKDIIFKRIKIRLTDDFSSETNEVGK